jgi:hypothetical protein
MQETTHEDRRKELRALLAQIEAHPERDWSEERKRIAVLNELIADHDTARG